MKKQVFGILAMFSLLLVLSVGSVDAKSKRRSINIPFNFNVGQKTLPAGEYIIEPIRRDSHNVWLVKNRKQNVSVLFTTVPVRNAETQEKTEVIFTNYEGQYFLSQIWTAGDISGRQLQTPRSKGESAKNRTQLEKVVIAADE